jgi:hypothetical protein
VALLTPIQRLIALPVAMLLIVCGGVRAGQATVTEAQAKAALLYNLLAFVEWPQGATGDKSLVIGVAGDTEVLDALRQVGVRAIKGHPVAVRDVREEDDPTHCHVLYLAAARDRMTAGLLRRVTGAPVLTVGDASEFERRGGIVFVYFERARLRFDVSLSNANKAQLKISSKVLGLARSVTTDGTTP